MFKSTWTYTALGFIVAAAGGGVYYFMTHSTIEQHVPPSVAAPPPAQSVPQDHDVERQTLEGIGSIKNLKQIPLQLAPQR